MNQPPDGSPASSLHSMALFSPTAPAVEGAGVAGAAPGYRRAGLRRVGLSAISKDGLEFSAGLKSLDFPANPELYTRALNAAIEMLHADGGVLAMLDPTGQRLLIRQERVIGVLEANYTALAMLGNPTQPGSKSREGPASPELEKTRPLPAVPTAAKTPSKPLTQMPASVEGEEESAEDVLGLASAGVTEAQARGYAWGAGFLGHVWKMNQALLLSNEKCRELPRDETTPPDQDLAWHIGAPIRVLDPLLPFAIDEPASVVGVIAVAFRDKHWSPPKRYMEMLQLHADRVALALQTAWLEETRHRQAKFLRLLHDVTLHFSTTLDQEQLFVELHQLVSAVLGTTSFTIMLYHRDHDKEEVEFAYTAERLAPEVAASAKHRTVKEKHMPAWWKKVKDGTIVTIATPEERQEYAKALHVGWLADEAYEAMLIVPLLTRTREHIIGALGVASNHPRSYTHEQIEMLETIAHTAAFAFENADLYDRSKSSLEQARNRKRQVAALNNAVNTLNASLNVDEILKKLVKQANLLTAAQLCTVLLYEEDGKTLVARASNASETRLLEWGLTALEDFRIQPTDDMMKQLRNGETVVLNDLEAERASETPEGEFYRHYEAHSVLLVPIQRQGTLQGLLVVYTPGKRHLFQPDEISLLEGLAGQAAVAIHNAQLYMDLERAYEQQKELDHLKDDFIVTASHEFRTPLSAIHGYASLLQRHSAKLTTDQARRFSTEITRAAQQLVGMVTTLMDASRLDSRKLLLSPQSVEVRSLAESALALVQPDIQQPIHMEIPADLWVHADPDRLRQVMTNLLTNAGKYSPPTSPIDFIARVEERFTLPDVPPTGKTGGLTSGGIDANGAPGAGSAAAQTEPSAYLIVSVVDRGDGITPEDQKKLFQKFVRLQRSLTTPVRGTGLGLYICRQYLSAMGGAIWVESAVGEGSTFHFALPLVPPPAEMAGNGKSPFTPHG
ncbi:MAG TPA: GAF domain-containing protein [Ktedonobacterales bacterium]|nr:GAF domain-containing protein [Ktedonobacterales bacterium]